MAFKTVVSNYANLILDFLLVKTALLWVKSQELDPCILKKWRSVLWM